MTCSESPETPYIPFDPEALSVIHRPAPRTPRTRSYSTASTSADCSKTEVDALDRYAQEVDRLTMPVAFLHGTDDPFVHERSLEAVRDMPSADLTVHVYEGRQRHEVLNETNRDEVIGHLADWMEPVSRAWNSRHRMRRPHSACRRQGHSALATRCRWHMLLAYDCNRHSCIHRIERPEGG